MAKNGLVTSTGVGGSMSLIGMQAVGRTKLVLVVIASYLYLVYTDDVKMLSPVKDDLLGVAS